MATLLTGVGYIGTPLLRRLVERGERVVALENFFSTKRQAVEAALPAGVELIVADVADSKAVARAFEHVSNGSSEQTVVYHLAAQPSAAVANKSPKLTEVSNLIGARVLLRAAKDYQARVVFGGSFRVYGDELIGQTVDEQAPYGKVGDLSHLSKVYVEQLARMIACAFVSVRLGVTYGLSPIMKTRPAFMTVPNAFCQRAAAGEVLQVLEDRPLAFVHVDDAVEALLFAADHFREGWHLVNAAPEVATIGQLARTVQRVAQARGDWVRIEGAAASEAGFSVRSRLDDEGFRPRRNLAGGVPDVYEFFRAARA